MNEPRLSRRSLLAAGAGAAMLSAARPAAGAGTAFPVLPPAPRAVAGAPRVEAALPRTIRPALLARALAALQAHGSAIAYHDRIAVADFAAPSSHPRLHLIDLAGGRVQALRVTHGSGSDPAHSGWLHRFSNAQGSNATSEGAFVTADYYVGRHGRSQRLIGLDPTNSNALARAIVIHGAWYADSAMIATHGQLGRSQGCFAVAEADLDELFARLGPGRMIWSAKL